jgi:hypothetical protein
MISIRTNANQFQGRAASIVAKAKNPRAVLLGMGREGANLLKNHFRQKDRTDINKLNPSRREHYWLGVSRAVQSPVVPSPTRVEIDINHPSIAQKVFGGPIVAKRVRNLSIPESPEAYGRTPATFEKETGLKLFVLKTGPQQTLVLAALRGPSGSGHPGQFEIEYLLTPRVNQKPDPTALPEEGKFADGVIERGQKILDREVEEI